MDAYDPSKSFLINSLPLNANQFEADSEAINSDPSILVWNTDLNVFQRVSTKTNEVLNQFDSAPVQRFKQYLAIITQTGTAAPVETILQNDLGGAVTYRYDGVGSYSVLSAGLFTVDKTAIIVGSPVMSLGLGAGIKFTGCHYYDDASEFGIYSCRQQTVEMVTSVVPSNDVFFKTTIDIRVKI